LFVPIIYIKFATDSQVCATIWVYPKFINRQPTPNRKPRSPYDVLCNKLAMGGKRVKTYRRRLSDAVFETSRISQIHNCCLEYGQRKMSQGVITPNLVEELQAQIVPIGLQPKVLYCYLYVIGFLYRRGL